MVSNSATPSSGTSENSPLSVTVTTSGSSPVSGPTAADAVPSSAVQAPGSTPKRQTLKELLASIPGFSLRVSKRRCLECGCTVWQALVCNRTSLCLL